MQLPRADHTPMHASRIWSRRTHRLLLLLPRHTRVTTFTVIIPQTHRWDTHTDFPRWIIPLIHAQKIPHQLIPTRMPFSETCIPLPLRWWHLFPWVCTTRCLCTSASFAIQALLQVFPWWASLWHMPYQAPHPRRAPTLSIVRSAGSRPCRLTALVHTVPTMPPC